MRAQFIGVTTAAIGLSLAVAACESGGPAKPAAPPAHAAAAAPRPPGVPAGTWGWICGKFPVTGPGSFSSMAADPVATAVSRIPVLSELARAIRAAGLTGMLNSAPPVTVFAPDNTAFTGLGSGNVATLLATKADLRKVLEFQIVAGRVSRAELASGRVLITLRGTRLRPARQAREYRIDNAKVICGPVRTANATVYIVNQVLIP